MVLTSEEKMQTHKSISVPVNRKESIERIMGLIMVTKDLARQDRLWKRVDALVDKIAGLEDGLVCDACGETFESEDGVEDVAARAKEEGWVSDDEGTFCPEHKTYHPDHVQIDYDRNILE